MPLEATVRAKNPLILKRKGTYSTTLACYVKGSMSAFRKDFRHEDLQKDIHIFRSNLGSCWDILARIHI